MVEPVTQLTPHFTLEEFLRSDTADELQIDNTPDPQSQQNLSRVAQVMEQVRHLLDDHTITVTSGYRCEQLNRAVGGATTSAHTCGLACDFVCTAFGTPEEICKALEPEIEYLGIDQLIHEYESWVHMGLSSGEPRYAALTISDNGTESGFG